MYEDVTERLQSLGYTVVYGDQYAIEFAIQKVTWTIRNECNIAEIHDGLHSIAVDMVCGEFLFAKKGAGSLDGFDLTPAVKQVQEGDASVTFAIENGSMTQEARLDALIGYLMGYGKNDLTSYRCVKW